MTDITKDMQKLISERLPEVTAGVLRDYIEQAEALKLEVKELTDAAIKAEATITSFTQEVRLLKARIENQQAMEEREEKVIEDEANLSDRELCIELEVAAIKLKEAEKRADTVERLVEKVFAHPRVQVTTSKGVPIMSAASAGAAPYETGRTYENTDEVTTETKD